MILGVGNDLICISEFAQQISDDASTFVAGNFTEQERRTAVSKAGTDPKFRYATRFAAKEATLKALDHALAHHPSPTERPQLSLLSIEVITDLHGRPWLKLHGRAKALAETLGIDRAWVSLSHDGDYASAVVILESIL